MQGLTHILMGIFIFTYLKGRIKKPYDIILIIVLSFFSHSILDAVAIATYHPPNALLDDPFWWTFHILDYSILAIFVIYYFKKCWYAMAAADLPDLWDWFMVRPIADWILKDPSLAERLYIHQYIFIIPSVCFAWLPDLRMEPIGIIPEIIVDLILFLLIFYKERKQKEEVKNMKSIQLDKIQNF